MTKSRIEGSSNNKITQTQSNACGRKSNTALKVVAFITVAGLIGFGAVGAFLPHQYLPSFLTGVIGTVGHEGAIACMAIGAFIIFLYGIVKTVKKFNQKRLEQKSHKKTIDKVSEIDKFMKDHLFKPYTIYFYQQTNTLYTFFYTKGMTDGSTKYIYVENCRTVDEGTADLVNKLDQLIHKSIGAFACSKGLEDLQLYRFRKKNEHIYTYFYRVDDIFYFIEDCYSRGTLDLLKARLAQIKQKEESLNAKVQKQLRQRHTIKKAGPHKKDSQNVTVQRALPVRGDLRIESAQLGHNFGFSPTEALRYLRNDFSHAERKFHIRNKMVHKQKMAI